MNERVIHFLWDVPVQSAVKVSNYTIIRPTFFLEIPRMSELGLFLTSNLNAVPSASTPHGSFSFVYNRTEKRLACQDSENPLPSGLDVLSPKWSCGFSRTDTSSPVCISFSLKLEPCLCCAYMADRHGFHSN